MESYIQRYHLASDKFRRKVLGELDTLIERMAIGVTRSQYYLLGAILEMEPCRITALADKMDVTPSAITVMIDRLVQANLVARYYDEKDRRAVLVRLTEAGKDALTKLDGIRKEHLTRALSLLDADELKAYVQTYEKLAHLYYSSE